MVIRAVQLTRFTLARDHLPGAWLGWGSDSLFLPAFLYEFLRACPLSGVSWVGFSLMRTQRSSSPGDQVGQESLPSFIVFLHFAQNTLLLPSTDSN